MGRSRRIELDTRVFEKAGDGTAFFSAMLNRYAAGDVVSDQDSLDLLALLKRHEDMAEKVGVGVDHFEVDYAPDGFPGNCFWIVRKDRSRTDFSFKHCLSPKPSDRGD